MKAGRPPLSLGAHGKISTRSLGNGRARAAARVRLWDGDVHLVTAVDATASDARALLERRITARLRLSELDAWRDLTARRSVRRTHVLLARLPLELHEHRRRPNVPGTSGW